MSFNNFLRATRFSQEKAIRARTMASAWTSPFSNSGAAFGRTWVNVMVARPYPYSTLNGPSHTVSGIACGSIIGGVLALRNVSAIPHSPGCASGTKDSCRPFSFRPSLQEEEA
jgi:hypothetical protein